MELEFGRRRKEIELMTNEEKQKTIEFTVEMDRRAAITVNRVEKVSAVNLSKKRADRRWKRTEARLHALLSHARKQARKREEERRITAPPSKRQSSLEAGTPNTTETDKRLHALAELVERQIRERRVGNS